MIPYGKFKEWATLLKSAFTVAKDKTCTVEEEDTRNKMVFQKLYTLVQKQGFTIAINKLKSFTLPIREFDRSRNDHCLYSP